MILRRRSAVWTHRPWTFHPLRVAVRLSESKVKVEIVWGMKSKMYQMLEVALPEGSASLLFTLESNGMWTLLVTCGEFKQGSTAVVLLAYISKPNFSYKKCSFLVVKQTKSMTNHIGSGFGLHKTKTNSLRFDLWDLCVHNIKLIDCFWRYVLFCCWFCSLFEHFKLCYVKCSQISK